MKHVLFNVQISKYLHLAFRKEIKKKVLINYTRHSSTISIRFTCNIYKSIGWAPGWYSWLKIFSFLRSMFPSVRTFFFLFEKRHQSLHLFQQFLPTFYVSFLFWMIIGNSCGTMLIFYPKKNLYLFSFTYENTITIVASNLI